MVDGGRVDGGRWTVDVRHFPMAPSGWSRSGSMLPSHPMFLACSPGRSDLDLMPEQIELRRGRGAAGSWLLAAGCWLLPQGFQQQMNS